MDKFFVNLGENSYNIIFGDSFAGLADEMKKINAPQKLLIVTDSNVEKLYADEVKNHLNSAGFDSEVYALRAGEEN